MEGDTRILHSSQQPLRADLDDLNRPFVSTAKRVTASSFVLNEDIYPLINRLSDYSHFLIPMHHARR